MKKSLYFILCFAFLNVLYATDEEIIVTSSLGGATLAEIDSQFLSSKAMTSIIRLQQILEKV